jgi:acyl carrier protein
MSSILSSLHQLISENLFPLDEFFCDEMDLYAEGLDSMALMQLILLLEQEFDIRLESSDLGRENFQSLRAIEELVRKKQSP